MSTENVKINRFTCRFLDNTLEKEYLANKCTMGSLKRPNCNIVNKESKKKSSKK